MKALIVFNHPAPYKVKLFNKLAEKIDLFVIFERKYANDRPKEFYTETEYSFKNMVLTKGYFSRENSFSFEVKKYIKKHYKEYDLIIMNGYSTISEQLAINWMIKHKIPYVLFINGGVKKESEPKLIRKLKRRYISHASAYLSPNEQASLFLTFYGANHSIKHYPYCTYYEKDIKKPNLSDKERNILREKYSLPNGKLFISASNFIPRKNNLEMFDAFKNEDCTLVLYGNGPMKNEYDEYLKVNEINNVIIRDFVPAGTLLEIMSCCDCFVTLSHEDIYGHTTMEALSAGIPVISSNKVVSSLAVIKDFENGFIVNGLSETKDAISKVDYHHMSKNCIETAKQYSVEKEAEVIAKALEDFVK